MLFVRNWGGFPRPDHRLGAPLVVGVITILKQFHSSHTHTFLGYLGQYVRSNISAGADKATELPPAVCKVGAPLEPRKKPPTRDAPTPITPRDVGAHDTRHATGTHALTPPPCPQVLAFLEEYCKFSGTSRKAIDAIVPSYIFDRFHEV